MNMKNALKVIVLLVSIIMSGCSSNQSTNESTNDGGKNIVVFKSIMESNIKYYLVRIEQLKNTGVISEAQYNFIKKFDTESDSLYNLSFNENTPSVYKSFYKKYYYLIDDEFDGILINKPNSISFDNVNTEIWDFTALTYKYLTIASIYEGIIETANIFNYLKPVAVPDYYNKNKNTIYLCGANKYMKIGVVFRDDTVYNDGLNMPVIKTNKVNPINIKKDSFIVIYDKGKNNIQYTGYFDR